METMTANFAGVTVETVGDVVEGKAFVRFYGTDAWIEVPADLVSGRMAEPKLPKVEGSVVQILKWGVTKEFRWYAMRIRGNRWHISCDKDLTYSTDDFLSQCKEFRIVYVPPTN